MFKNFLSFVLDDKITILPLTLFTEKITCDFQEKVCILEDNESLILPKWDMGIEKIKMYVEGIERLAGVIDDFEEYEGTSQLKQVWKTNSTFVDLELVFLNTKMMKMKLKKSVAKDVMIYRSFTPAVNWIDFDGVKMTFFQSDFESSFSFYISDGRIKLIRTIDLNKEKSFEEVYLWFSEFQQVGTGNFDFGNIREMGFIVTKCSQNTYAYVDNIVLLNRACDLEIAVGNYDVENNMFFEEKKYEFNLRRGVNVFEIEVAGINEASWNSVKVTKTAGGLDCAFWGQQVEGMTGVYKISGDTRTELDTLIHYSYLKPVLYPQIKRIILYPDVEFEYDIIRVKHFYPEATAFHVVFEEMMRGNEYVIDLSKHALTGKLFLEIERKSKVKKIECVVEYEAEEY